MATTQQSSTTVPAAVVTPEQLADALRDLSDDSEGGGAAGTTTADGFVLTPSDTSLNNSTEQLPAIPVSLTSSISSSSGDLGASGSGGEMATVLPTVPRSSAVVTWTSVRGVTEKLSH